MPAASITNTKKEKALPVPNATKAKNEKSIACNEYHKYQKGERHCLQLVSQSQNEKSLPATSITNTKNEKGIACNECHNCQKRGGQCKKRSSPHRGKTKRERLEKSFSFQFGVRCGARTHDTQNHNLVLYQLN